MTANQLYEKFLTKSEKNGTNDFLATNKKRFALLFNEAQNKLQEYYYEKKNEDDLRYIQNTLVKEYDLVNLTKKNSLYSFELPSDYFEYTTSRAVAKKGNCKDYIDLYEYKNFNRNFLNSDSFTLPSFEYREAFVTISSNKLHIETNGLFSVNKIILDYYRYPKQVKLLDPSNPESNFDNSYEMDFDDKFLDRVISLAVAELDINTLNSRWELNTLRSKNK